MRRRLRSAAFPLHRHSIPQLAIDGALVAAAYYLSYRLRFDTGTPARYERLFDATIVFVVVSALVVFTLFRLELKQWRYTSSRDYLGIGQAVVINTLVLAKRTEAAGERVRREPALLADMLTAPLR